MALSWIWLVMMMHKIDEVSHYRANWYTR